MSWLVLFLFYGLLPVEINHNISMSMFQDLGSRELGDKTDQGSGAVRKVVTAKGQGMNRSKVPV